MPKAVRSLINVQRNERRFAPDGRDGLTVGRVGRYENYVSAFLRWSEFQISSPRVPTMVSDGTELFYRARVGNG